MWDCVAITVEIGLVDGEVMIIKVTTPVGLVQIIGKVTRVGRLLHVAGAHIDVDGLHGGALGRTGLNAIARKLLEEADVDQIIIEGGTRTTGKNPGRPPRVFRFPSH
jgi:predicted TIM-barrel enzyme